MAWTFLARSTGAGPVCTCVQLCVDTNLNSGNQIIIAHKSHLQGIQTFGSLINIKHYLSFHTQQRMSRFDFGAVRSDCEWNALVCIRDQSNLRPIILHYPGYSQSLCLTPASSGETGDCLSVVRSGLQQYWPLIGGVWSRDLDTEPWLAETGLHMITSFLWPDSSKAMGNW